MNYILYLFEIRTPAQSLILGTDLIIATYLNVNYDDIDHFLNQNNRY